MEVVATNVPEITSTLLVLPEEIRDKIFGMLSNCVQIGLEINSHDIIFKVLNPYNRRVDAAIVSKSIFGLGILCEFYGISRATMTDYCLDQIIYIQPVKLLNSRCFNRCRQCIIYSIKLALRYYAHFKNDFNYIVMHQVQYYKINLQDICNFHALKCAAAADQKELIIPEIDYLTMLDTHLIKLLIDNYNIWGATKYNLGLISITDYKQYAYLHTSLSKWLTMLQDAHIVHLIERYDSGLCNKCYAIIESQSNRLEYKLVWPELIIATDATTIKLISAQYTKNLLHHLKLRDDEVFSMIRCNIINYISIYYPAIIFDKSIISYINRVCKSRNASKESKLYMNLFHDISNAYNKFINE